MEDNMIPKFKVGDKVRFKLGGPVVMVNSVSAIQHNQFNANVDDAGFLCVEYCIGIMLTIYSLLAHSTKSFCS